ncbi:uncharacterized protein F5147DRAFT_247853 [Suillus discolor]|uniref:Uncharacterized protein n=1 Tax=Suillus discolor TaxID=1912936 RepID=A0A9P7FH40_9AGAM|nr:uncharacterized protein F5147DRAFT_247853 [Suillus discolor]KAG2117775.1 hypothetical protein F5147DRAFT_247853 [Suillus discolor]
MSGVENQVASHDVVFAEDGTIDNLSDAVAKVSLRPDNSSSQSPESPTDTLNKDKNDIHSRPFVMYSRLHLLLLHKSPLVCTPTGMPALKDWFGSESDQGNLKKDSEALPQPNARDRRFRRDAEDGEGAARPSFRGAAITQPSQMGNFKHQSIRAADRDRDRDTDREQERDSRVKDGQERLRNLSDKYDRDRRALSSMQQLRGKDRDLTPHIGGTSSRIASQSQQAPSNRQLDSREPSKKKDGETSEDWRRESTRTGRERSDNPRRDRDERDRPRSRVRDSSRPRRDVSPSRRDRDDRDRDRRGDRDDHQKEAAGYRRDDRELDRESEVDDPRRWRDDGKRDERMAARRDREQRDRERDKDRVRDRPAAWDAGDRQDRRWAPTDDRDGRNKRAAGRERKPDEAKDRDDRKDRDREREKEREKEPAWMDTYIPSSGSSGLGRAPGDLDGIQAFKREIKEREQKEQGTAAQDGDRSGDFEGKANTSEPHLDEIQLFKLMMKREEQKKKSDQSPLAGPSLLADTSSETKGSTPTNDLSSVEATTEHRTYLPPQPISSQLSNSPPSPQAESALHDGSRALLSMISPSSSSIAPGVSTGAPESDIDKEKPGGSRFFPKPISTDLPAPQALPKPSIEVLSTAVPSAPHAAPPPGCRLLSFASKTPQGSVGHTPPSYTGSHSPVSVSKNGTPVINSTIPSNGPLSTIHHNDNPDAVRVTRGFSPFEEAREGLGLSPLDAFRRTSVAPPGDRNAFGHMTVEQVDVPISGPLPSHSIPYEQLNPGIAAAKGSRFAKFFDGKGRDSQPGMGKAPMGGPTPAQRGELSGYNGIHTGNPDARAMEDIFAMLSNSAHGQRPHILPEALASDAAHFNHPSNLHHLQNQLGHSQHYPGHTRLDSLYDSRLDDRNFVPDGMVPGLRSAAPPRSRQNSAMLSDIDDSMQFGGQRGPPQMYQGLHQANMNRNGGIPLQSSQFRGGPSPNPLQPSAQRLPPGLANLGGRPPHEPAQFLNSAMAIPGGLHGPVHGNAALQQQFNNFPPGGVGFNGAPQMRVPHPGGTHQLHGHNTMQGLMHPGGLNPAQAQLLGLNGANGMPGNLRGPNGGFGQQGPQIQPPLLSMRQQQQQQQQQIPPHMLPLHYQQQGPLGPTNQPAHDLMALLMSGGRRE